MLVAVCGSQQAYKLDLGYNASEQLLRTVAQAGCLVDARSSQHRGGNGKDDQFGFGFSAGHLARVTTPSRGLYYLGREAA